MKVHRSSQELQDTIDGYKILIEEYKKQIFELKQIASENEKNKNLLQGWKKFSYENEKNINLLQGYKKVIEDLSIKLRKNS
jgi:pyoverdine/dityrosine biosynthesis protein Dit1